MTGRLLLLGVILAAGLTGPADARERRHDRGDEQTQDRSTGTWRDGREDREDSPRRGDPAAAAREAQARNGGGRVLSVEPEGDGYRVKVLKNGEVRTHHVGHD